MAKHRPIELANKSAYENQMSSDGRIAMIADFSNKFLRKWRRKVPPAFDARCVRLVLWRRESSGLSGWWRASRGGRMFVVDTLCMYTSALNAHAACDDARNRVFAGFLAHRLRLRNVAFDGEFQSISCSDSALRSYRRECIESDREA